MITGPEKRGSLTIFDILEAQGGANDPGVYIHDTFLSRSNSFSAGWEAANNPVAEIHLLDAGQSAPESEGPKIAAIVRAFHPRLPMP